MRHPVVISSLEEDFKNLGLVDDKKEATAEPSEEPVEEGRRRAAGKGRMVRTVKMRGKEKQKAKAWERAHKAERKRKAKRRKKTAQYKKLARIGKRFESEEPRGTLRNGALSGLFEEVETILSSLDEDRVENAIKSFANVAIIAEMLSEFFDAVLQEDIEDKQLIEELSEASEFFDDLSESAAQVATSLNEGEDLDVTLDEIEEAFNEQMESLVEGLEFYADLTEDDDLDEDEDLEEMEYGDDDDMDYKMKMMKKMGKKK